MPRTQIGGGAVYRGVRGLLIGFPITLFTSALVSDIAYLKSAEIQWTNFSAWLITGALVFGGVVIALAAVQTVFSWRSVNRVPRLIYLGLWVGAWILGLVNAFKHSQDGWSSVGALGLILSILCTLLALAAGFIAFSGWTSNREDAR